ncbi:MAG TPA: cysteine peptidase family C39 domain-containing protein [Fimbriimonadaceae bacterium]|nr:cysteine peptidase family C39 domain-containing protein [Fimbriimonadaceae bacterium]
MRRTWLGLASGVLGAIGVAGLVLFSPPAEPQTKALPLSAEAKERAEADRLLGSGQLKDSELAYRGFIDKHAHSKDPVVQDHVGAARIRLGYVASRSGDYRGAREHFVIAAKEYRGTGQLKGDFGGIQDQALYQAAVCLEAQRKPQEAGAAYRDFIRENPRSPLVHAAYRRLVRLNGGKSTLELDELLQSAVTKQEEHIRFEMSVCGPKAAAQLIALLKGKSPDYKHLAKLCGTTGDGTTLEGLRKGLKSFGVPSYGFVLNRADFDKLHHPAILLDEGHYVVTLKREAQDLVIFDPVYGGERKVRLPDRDDKTFTATVLSTRSDLSLENTL